MYLIDPGLLSCLFLYEFGQIVSFQDLIYFIQVIKFMDLESVIVFFSYPSNVHGNSGDVCSFGFDISHLCLLSYILSQPG